MGKDVNVIVVGIRVPIHHPRALTEPHLFKIRLGDLAPCLIRKPLFFGKRQRHVEDVLFHPGVHLPIHIPLLGHLVGTATGEISPDTLGGRLKVDVARSSGEVRTERDVLNHAEPPRSACCSSRCDSSKSSLERRSRRSASTPRWPNELALRHARHASAAISKTAAP